MKIKLRIGPKVTREQLIERIPALVKSAIETIIEKGIPMSGNPFRSHPVKAIAEAEDGLFEQGSDALGGLRAWLSRKLLGRSLQKSEVDKDDYRAQMLESHGINLGSKVTYEQAQEINEVLDLVPDDAFGDKLKTISVDGRFGAPKRKYPNHGRYYEEDRRIVLNPRIFGEDTEYKDGQGHHIPKIKHTLLHELGHTIDDRHGLSDKKEWRAISDWKYIGDAEPPEGYERLEIEDTGSGSLKGRWAYKEGTNFPRWYGARNPKEDFCESFVFALLGCEERFSGESGRKKLAFVKKVIERLVKSDNPSLGMQEDDELAKSQEFVAYCGMRLPSLSHMDDIEAFEVAKSEFQHEDCDDLGYEFEKAGMGNVSPGVAPPKAGAPQAKAAGSGAPGVKGPNPLKGQMKPGHKYLYRETKPDGTYRYWYKLPDGRVYTTDKALHDENATKPEAATQTEWGKVAQELGIDWAGFQQADEETQKNLLKTWNVGEHEQAKPGDFPDPDKPAIPQLINNEVKPNAATFDPHASEADKEKAAEEAEKEDEKKGIVKKQKREPVDYMLTVEDEKAIEAALENWEIEKFDPDFGQSGVNVSIKVKLKNDGWALLKPMVGSLGMGKNKIRWETFVETSCPYREVLAYRIDKALKWHLVPPTVMREVKGAALRSKSPVTDNSGKKEMKTISDFVSKKLDKFVSDKRIDAAYKEELARMFAERKENRASIQFFASGGKFITSGGMEEYVRDTSDKGMPQQEAMRMCLFDMLIDHQDRHQENMLFIKDPDPENRYGGTYRFVAIDNGYAFGEGQKSVTRIYDSLKKRCVGAPIDKQTLRDLRELRKDLTDKRRRRKIIDKDIRENVPNHQIQRMVGRIDFILGKGRRDKKGQVPCPAWEDVRANDQKKSTPYPGGRPDAANHPYDITGATNLVDRKMAVPMFKGVKEMKDFLHPLIAGGHLYGKQLESLNEFIQTIEQKDYSQAYIYLKTFVRHSPKSLVSQLMVNQKFGERVWDAKKNAYHLNQMKGFVASYLDRDFVGELHGQVKSQGGQAALDKLIRGDMKPDELKKLLGVTTHEKFESRGVIPKEAKAHGSKTDAIFDNPENFQWPAGGPKGTMVELSDAPKLIVRLEK